MKEYYFINLGIRNNKPVLKPEFDEYIEKNGRHVAEFIGAGFKHYYAYTNDKERTRHQEWLDD